jgi:3alpha(or 20beta)-hydroxysteroid dehydrogenase
MTGRLAGRVAIITGGARGQGASHAERLAREGATVLTGDVLDDAGEETAARLRADGLDVTYRHLDVTDPADWAGAVAACARLDVLVNNAGIIHVTPLLEETVDAWNGLLAVNATGTLLGMQAAIPAMRAGGGGSIINVASIFGVTGAEGYVAYTASKAAILAMTKTAALEHAADGIRVNAICPGGVSTPMNENEPEGGVVPLTPLGRRAHVSEISGAVAYLASDDASFVTGTELAVDGGYLAR